MQHAGKRLQELKGYELVFFLDDFKEFFDLIIGLNIGHEFGEVHLGDFLWLFVFFLAMEANEEGVIDVE